MQKHLIILVFAGFMLAACDTGQSNNLAAQDRPAKPVNPQLAGSMIVGQVTGGSNYARNPESVTDDQFKNGLIESLGARYLLAANPAVARYRIDVALNFNQQTSDSYGHYASGDAIYTITSIADNRRVFNQVIHSNADVNKGPYLDSEEYTRDTYKKAASSSITGFMKLLDAWSPPR